MVNTSTKQFYKFVLIRPVYGRNKMQYNITKIISQACRRRTSENIVKVTFFTVQIAFSRMSKYFCHLTMNTDAICTLYHDW